MRHVLLVSLFAVGLLGASNAAAAPLASGEGRVHLL